jgi:transposase
MNHGVLYVGVDVHEKESQLAVLEKEGSLVMEERIPTKDLDKFLSSLPGEKRVAIESVGFIHPIYEKLSSIQDCTVSVANPNKLRLISESGTKNDRNDARILGDLLRTNYLPLAHMRDKETREKLIVIEDRVRYGVRRGELKASIRWMLKRRGIEEPKDLFSIDGRKGLRELRLQEVDHRLDELELMDSFIERLDAQIAEIASRDEGARLLDTIPGIAPYTALYLSSALDDIDRFPDSKHACAYLGLVPWLDETADKTHLGHITKKGDKYLRRNLVECARAAVRKDAHLNEFYMRLKHKRGEKRAIIAVARKLVSYAYWVLKRKITYEELSPWLEA